MGMNLHKMIKSVITPVVQRSNISILLYDGQVNDDEGNVSVAYDAPYTTQAQVQLTSRQTLEHIEGANFTKVYKDFRIDSLDLTGLNRNLSTGGDYITMNGLFYKIVALPENFVTGWVWVIGCESTGLWQ
jgi:hypothetical protein